MNIAKDSVVSFHYQMADEAGNVLESSAGSTPTVYLQGHGAMMQGIEDALEGRVAGDELDVTLSPEQAYGMPKPNAQMRIPRKHLLNKGRLQVGQVVQVNTENGARQATVVKVGLKTVDIDSNHPLAGKTLVFKLNVVDVREATAEEKSHGHVHGHGGCGH